MSVFCLIINKMYLSKIIILIILILIKMNHNILSIDIGVKHLSLVLTEVNKITNTIIEIKNIELVDITLYTHNTIHEEDCQLHHTKTFFDWLSHIVQEYKYYFEESEIILIERQPPQGFVVVEQILFGFFRDKSILLAPNSVHKFHNFQQLDYDQRKIASEIISLPYLTEDLRIKLKTLDRAHDITDGILQLLFYLNRERIKEEINILDNELIKMDLELKEVQITPLQKSLNDLEKYRYKPT